jgi:glycine hydroxymethyltransferase
LIADWIDRAITAHDNDQALDRIAAEVEELLSTL